MRIDIRQILLLEYAHKKKYNYIFNQCDTKQRLKLLLQTMQGSVER